MTIFRRIPHHKGIFWLGNFLIAASLGLAVFIYYPLAAAYFPSDAHAQERSSGEFFITIPKINASAPIITGVDPWNEAHYGPALEKGVAQAKGSSLPGQHGLIFLFAHSSELPWKQTRENTAFLRLGELGRGDLIIITKADQRYTYQVVGKAEVWPTQVQYVLGIKDDELVLQTCTPVGTDFKRLLVYAKPL